MWSNPFVVHRKVEKTFDVQRKVSSSSSSSNTIVVVVVVVVSSSNRLEKTEFCVLHLVALSRGLRAKGFGGLKG